MSVVDWKQQFFKDNQSIQLWHFWWGRYQSGRKDWSKVFRSVGDSKRKNSNTQNAAQGIFQIPASTCLVKAENTRLNSTGSSRITILFAIPPTSNPWGNVHHLRAWKVATVIKNQDDMRHLLLFNESFNVLHCFVLYNHSLCFYIWGSESKQPFCCSAHLWL